MHIVERRKTVADVCLAMAFAVSPRRALFQRSYGRDGDRT
jgi:hypothetical protein